MVDERGRRGQLMKAPKGCPPRANPAMACLYAIELELEAH